MTSLLLCAVAFLIGAVAGARSLSTGLGAVLGVGYAYGIVRANVTETFSHFIFDSAVLGLYLTRLLRPLSPAERLRTGPLMSWLTLLVGWPVCLLFFPLQHPFVQLVGFRGNAFLLPFLLLGARLRRDDAYPLALWVAGLNLLAFGFAVTEFFVGIERFYPRNEVTRLIYLSNDVAGYKAYRIPACFSSSAAYGGMMAATLPWLIGAWSSPRRKAWHNTFLLTALLGTVLGVFLSASRSAAVVMAVLLGGLVLIKRLRPNVWLGLGAVLLVVGYLVAREERLQRFAELQDADYVMSRIHGSVNMSLLEAMVEYPLGNGLGGGGTSIPYFLQPYLSHVVLFENEYARIALEQGLPGLFLWVGFILWVLTRPIGDTRDPWGAARWLIRLHCMILFGMGLLGTGLLTSIPWTAFWCIGAGWITTAPAVAPVRYAAVRPVRAVS